MRTLHDIGQQVQKPEYRQALQELIKYELQALVERLSETGEEAVVLTASLQNGTSTQLASSKAEGFLLRQKSLGSQFLNYFNDEGENSSGDEFGEDVDIQNTSTSLLPNITTTSQFGPNKDNVHGKEKSPGSRERTTSRRLSLSRDDQKGCNMYEVSQTSDLSASERNDSASSVASFVEAQEQERQTYNLQCKVCDRTFRSYKTLNLHIRRHLVKSFKCSLCGKIFSVKSSYQRHIKTHNKNQVFECGFCDKSFPDQASWKQHRERHFGARNYSCNLCGKAFYEKYSLKVHQTSHFISNQRVDKNVDSNAGFSCHICQKLLKTKAALKRHILTHSAKKYACEFCNKRFSLKYSYVRHRRLHTGETPYKCGSCGKQFSDSSAWAKHVRTHSGIKPYSCDICSKSFYEKTSCKTHMKKHKVKMGTHNFDMLSTELSKKNFIEHRLNKEQTTQKSDIVGQLDIHSTNNESFVHVSMPLDEIETEFDSSNMLDSGFGADLMTNNDDEREKSEINVQNNQTGSIFDSVELDENFQKEFVERNMPLKDVESDNEFISTTFPDESDLLDETDTETKNTEETSEVPETAKSGSNINDQQNNKCLKKTTKKWIPESPSKCKKCRKTFKHESLLKQHLQFHCMMKLYKCRFCGKQLSTRHSLVRHERIHVGDRPYQCYICQKNFADNYGCIRHVKKHFNREGRSLTPNNISKQTFRPSVDISKLTKSDDQMNDVSTGKDTNTYSEENSEETAKLNTQQSAESVNSSSSPPKLNIKLTQCDLISTNAIQQVETANSVKLSRHNSHESKSLYRCYNCSALYPSQQDCIKHIQQNCNKDIQSEYISVPHRPDCQSVEKDSPRLKNIYQCSVCKLMFNEETACRVHQAQSCQKPNSSSQSTHKLPQESVEFPSKQGTNLDLTNLPFQEVNTSHSLLGRDNECLILSNDIESEVTETQFTATSPIKDQLVIDTSAFLTYEPGTECTNIDVPHLTSKHSSPPRADIKFTGLIAKSNTAPQGNFVVTSQGISLVTSGLTSMPTLSTENMAAIDVKLSKSSAKEKKVSSEVNITERTCSICNKIFTNKHILKQHVLIHTERKFGCKYCLKKFHNKYGRDRHERIHTGEKPYSCPNCRKAFSDNSTYRKHTRVCCSGK